jgi:hypothetical protein
MAKATARELAAMWSHKDASRATLNFGRFQAGVYPLGEGFAGTVHIWDQEEDLPEQPTVQAAKLACQRVYYRYRRNLESEARAHGIVPAPADPVQEERL